MKNIPELPGCGHMGDEISPDLHVSRSFNEDEELPAVPPGTFGET